MKIISVKLLTEEVIVERVDVIGNIVIISPMKMPVVIGIEVTVIHIPDAPTRRESDVCPNCGGCHTPMRRDMSPTIHDDIHMIDLLNRLRKIQPPAHV